MKTLSLALALAIIAFAAHPAFAGKKGGVTMPDSITVEGKSLKLNGMGIREATVFNVDVYVAGLYLEKKTKNGNEAVNSDQVKRIAMTFVREVDRGKLTDAWREGFKKNSGKDYDSLKADVKKLNSWMSAVKEGDSMSFTYAPGKGTTVHVNGKNKGTVAGTYFGRVMFAIFLAKAPNAGLKKGLLGR